MKKICIIYGGPSSEHDVSIMTVKAILENINTEKYEIWLLYIDRNLESFLRKYFLGDNFKYDTNSNFWADIIKLKDFDLCFLAMHGEFGEDGTIQSLLELYNIPYTGSDSYSSRLSMDKYRSSILVNSKLSIDIPKTLLVKKSEIIENNKIDYPLILKPNRLGSSVGVYLVENEEMLNRVLTIEVDTFNGDMEYLIHEAITDSIEISCGVLQRKNGEYIKLPPIEISPLKSSFFDYESKYKEGGANEISPPISIPASLSKRISKISQDIHKLLGCKLYSRSDFLIKDNKIYYLETNTLPGLTKTSLLPKECNAINMPYSELIDFLIENTV